MSSSHSPFHFLVRIHPLVKILAIFPLFVQASLTENRWSLIILILESFILLFVGSGIPKKKFFLILGTLFLGTAFYFVLFSFTAPAKKGSPLLFSFGSLSLYQAGVQEGITNSIRVLTLVFLSFLFTGTTSVTTLLYGLMQQGRLPYPIGYSIAAAYHFVPVLQQDLQFIRSAQHIRGFVGKTPWVLYQKLKRLAITLFVCSIRRADRLSLSMEARSFGAFPTCTYYRQLHITKQDRLFFVGYLLINSVLFYFSPS